MKNPVLIAQNAYMRLPRETVRYIIAGILTTLVDFVVFEVSISLGVEDIAANRISIAAAVLFAYVINKLYVFKRRTGSFSALAVEFFKFLGGRALTALPEFWGFPVLLRLLGERETITKAITIAVVFILNYVISKMFVFRRKKSERHGTYWRPSRK